MDILVAKIMVACLLIKKTKTKLAPSAPGMLTDVSQFPKRSEKRHLTPNLGGFHRHCPGFDASLCVAGQRDCAPQSGVTREVGRYRVSAPPQTLTQTLEDEKRRRHGFALEERRNQRKTGLVLGQSKHTEPAAGTESSSEGPGSAGDSALAWRSGRAPAGSDLELAAVTRDTAS